MRIVRVVPSLAIALLLVGGSARAQAPFENPELADVVSAFFWNFGKAGTSAVMATMTGAYGAGRQRLVGFRYVSTATGKGYGGVVAFELYEPDDVRRTGAGSWQMKQTDYVQMAFSIHGPGSSALSNASPTWTYVAGLYSYLLGQPAPSSYYSMYYALDHSAAQLQGCNATITTKDKNRDGIPESASWKAGCNPKALEFLSQDDQKLYKKVLKGLKGKGVFPAFRAIYY
jgi:hypothetical protein